MLNNVKDAMAPESSLPGRPAYDVLNRDGISVADLSEEPDLVVFKMTYTNARVQLRDPAVQHSAAYTQ